MKGLTVRSGGRCRMDGWSNKFIKTIGSFCISSFYMQSGLGIKSDGLYPMISY